MEIRKFRVSFEEIVGPDATELAFGPGDYLIIRSIFGMPTTSIRDFQERLAKVTEDTAAEEADGLILDLIGRCVAEWHLETAEGSIPIPRTSEDLNALPGAIRGSLFGFLSGFRGKPDPTAAG